jgi:hypothetical protein
MEANFAELLPVLVQRGVRFIVIGGGAAIAHGSARLTSDVAVVYSREPQNIRNLAAALQNYAPYLRGAPPGLPFYWDENTIKNGLNFTLKRIWVTWICWGKSPEAVIISTSFPFRKK